MNSDDQRRAKRKNSSIVVEFYDSKGALLLGVGRLLNISKTGGLVETGLSFRPEQDLHLRIRWPTHAITEKRAKVVRTHRKKTKQIYGIVFTDSPISMEEELL